MDEECKSVATEMLQTVNCARVNQGKRRNPYLLLPNECRGAEADLHIPP